MTGDVIPEVVNNESPQPNLTDGEDESFCGQQKPDTAKDSAPTENTQEDIASQNSMDCGSAGGSDESGLAESSRSNAAQTHCSNGQKCKRPSSPGPHPVKATCIDVQSPSPKLTLGLSPRKGVSTPSDVEMLSPDSPVCKTMLTSISADKDHDGGACVEDSGSAKAQEIELQPSVKDSDSGKSAKEGTPHLVAMGTEVAECSGSSDMSQELTSSQPSERY